MRARFRIRTYTITYTYDGGAPEGNDETGFIKQYSSLTAVDEALPGNEDVYKLGYELANWKLKGSDAGFTTIGGMLDALRSLEGAGAIRNVVLVARWNPSERTVYLHRNIGGISNPDLVTTDETHGILVRTGSRIQIRLEDTSAMENYVLLGWSTSANSRAIAVAVGTDPMGGDYGVGYYTVKTETDEANGAWETSNNNLYAVWHVKGEQTLIMGTDATDGATEVTYTGSTFNVTAYPLEPYTTSGGAITLRYQWFRNGKLVHTETKTTADTTGAADWSKSTLEVRNVADSGTYTCLLTVTGSLSGETSTSAEGEIEIKINKTDYTQLSFNNVRGEKYDGQIREHYVLFGTENKPAVNYIEIGVNQADWIKVRYSYELNGEQVTAIRNAGTYTVTATFEVPENSNYNAIDAQTSLYEIEKQTINSVEYAMYNVDGTTETEIETEDFVVKYNGKKYVIRATSGDILAGDVVGIELSDFEALNVGIYEAVLTGVLTGKDAGNYEFAMQSRSLNATRRYEIERASHDLSKVEFADSEVVYDGNIHELYLKYDGKEVKSGTEVIDGTLTISYGINIELNNGNYAATGATGNGGVAAGEYTITVTFNETDPNYESIADRVAVLTVKKAKVFEAYDKEGLLGSFHNDSRGYNPNAYTKKEIDGADGELRFTDVSKFKITYIYEQWAGGSYSPIYDGNTEDYTAFAGIRQAGNYRIRAHIEYAEGAEDWKNNYEAIEDIEIAYTISRASVERIEVKWTEGYDGYRLGEAFESGAIEWIKVYYGQEAGESEQQSETFSGEALNSCEITDGATGKEITAFTHVGRYSIKVKFLGVESEEAREITVKQEISEITRWEYREDKPGTSWAEIPEEGIEYSGSGYEFRGAFDCIGEDGNATVSYVGARASGALNYSESAYKLTTETSTGNYVVEELTFEGLLINKNTKESVKWYYNNGATEEEIGEDTLVYNGSAFESGYIYAKFGETKFDEWRIEEGGSTIVNAGEYKLVATQGVKEPNYALNGLERTIKVNPQVLSSTDYAVKYEDGTGSYVEIPATLEYKGAAYTVKIFMADGKEITVWGEKDGKTYKELRKGGKYQLTCGADNYVLAEGAELPQLEITPVAITVTWGESEFEYDGSEKSIQGSTDGAVGEDANGDILELIGNVTEVNADDTYTAVAQVAEEYAGSYVIEGGDVRPWRIKPKAVEITWSDGAPIEYAYNGKPQTPTIAGTNIEAADKDKIVITLSYTYAGSDIARSEIVNVDDKYGVRAVFGVASGADPEVLNNYSYENVSTTFAIVQAEPELGEVEYAEYKTETSTNVTYVNRPLRADKIVYANSANVKGSFAFIDGEGNELNEVKFDKTGGQTVKVRFTPEDVTSYKVKEQELTVIVREDMPTTGPDSLIVEIAAGTNQYIVNTQFDLTTVSVYQRFTSYYKENGVEYGYKQRLTSWNNLTLSINGVNDVKENGYRFSEDDLPEGEDAGVVKLNAVLSNVFRGSADVMLSKLMPKSISIANPEALKREWYEGETFDFSELRFTVIYTNDKPGSSAISGSMLGCEISDMTGTAFTAADAGEHTVTFRYFDAETTAKIEVKAKEELKVNYKSEYAFGYTGSEIDWKSQITFTDDKLTAEEIGVVINASVTDAAGNPAKVIGSADGEVTYNVTVTLTVNNAKYKYTGPAISFEIVVTNKLYEIEFDPQLPAEGYEWRNAVIELPDGELKSVRDVNGNTVSGVTYRYAYEKAGAAVTQVKDSGDYTLIVTFVLENEEIEVKRYAFKVKAAANVINNFRVESVKVGETVNPVASATYGEVEFVYSTQRNGTYSATKPTEAGIYYVKAVVEGTSNYAGVTMSNEQALRFTINEESISTSEKVEENPIVEISDEVRGIEYGTTVSTAKIEDAGELNVGNLLEGYELKLRNSTGEATLENAVTVRLLISEELKGRTDLNVYFIDGEGNAHNMDAKVEGDYLVFTAEGLTSGRLAVTYREPGQPTGLIAAVVVLGVVAAGMVTACGIVFAKKRRSK